MKTNNWKLIMSNNDSKKLPLWVQDREKVIANGQGVEWREGKQIQLATLAYTYLVLKPSSQSIRFLPYLQEQMT